MTGSDPVRVGAIPAAAAIFMRLKPQETGTGLLIRFGEVATTSGRTISFHLQGVLSAADGLPRKEEDAGATPAALTKFWMDGWQSSNAPVPKTE